MYTAGRKRILYGMAWQEDLHDFIKDLSTGVHVWGTDAVVEGHKGLLTYTPTLVKVRRKKGSVTIEGEGLSVRAVSRDEVWITGDVKAVRIDA